jgi:3-deoxy-D-manno-octulosonate 8-phosphate phosphatase KdsC-like HAD superfamily phosphatase
MPAVLHTQALPPLLLFPLLPQVLPLGASKGEGVSWLLQHLRMSPSGMLALGDGENDIEMLQMAAVSAAMGNAGAKVKAAADYVMATNDEDGVAQAIQQFVLGPRGAAAGSSSVPSEAVAGSKE